MGSSLAVNSFGINLHYFRVKFYVRIKMKSMQNYIQLVIKARLNVCSGKNELLSILINDIKHDIKYLI